jgi:hypothetical protein
VALQNPDVTINYSQYIQIMQWKTTALQSTTA